MPDKSIFKVVNAKKSFGKTPALQGANLEVATGEILAIMGPSGSGKSTLMHCMAGIFLPDSGEVWFGDQQLNALNETKRTEIRRQEFGFVFQFGQLVPELTAADNVALPLTLNKVGRDEAYGKAEQWLDKLGLKGLGSRRSGELSGGQSQRVAIARALAASPKVIFADEPTGSLDSVSGENVMEILIELSKAKKVTVVLVTHDPRIAAYADREVMVRDGKVVTAKTAVV